ncbi:MAG TPA: hypothetical protein VI670_27625 [Thermoanaerobaculia bacterium]
MIFLAAWIVLWCYGGGTTIGGLLDPEKRDLFAMVGLVPWALGLCLALYSVFWQTVGMEIVTLSPTTLKIKNDIAGLGRTREYDVQSLRNLRVSPLGWSERRRSMNPGIIAFDYGSATVRFGGGVDEAEAASIVAHLKSRHNFA